MENNIFTFDENDIKEFKKTLNYQHGLLPEIEYLIKEKKISEEFAFQIIRYKAEEYKVFTQNSKVSENLYYLLKHCYSTFDITDYLLDSLVLKKYFLVINKNSKLVFDKILESEGLFLPYIEHTGLLDKSILIYTGLLKNKSYNPYQSILKKAKESGTNVACFYYSGKENHENGVGFLYREASRFSVNATSTEDQSRAKGGFRLDLGTGFKSSWEANIARILNFQKTKWYYEYLYIQVPQSIYVPDFYYSKEGDEVIVEVKGKWDLRSVEKISYILREESSYKLLIIDSDLYSFLSVKYSTLMNWEEDRKISTSVLVPVNKMDRKNHEKYINVFKKGEEVKLLREYSNPDDIYAIRIENLHGEVLGYVTKEWSSILSWKINFGFKYKGEIHLNKKEGYEFKIKIAVDFDSAVEERVSKNLKEFHLI